MFYFLRSILIVADVGSISYKVMYIQGQLQRKMQSPSWQFHIYTLESWLLGCSILFQSKQYTAQEYLYWIKLKRQYWATLGSEQWR